jgi:phage regulator Rha-like protein
MGKKQVSNANALVPVERIEGCILVIRGEKVILDSDLAELYGVQVRALNQAVRRNTERFPRDFMFQLTIEEARSLRSQFVTIERGRGRHRKYLPYAFTEHGAIMAASVLNSERAVKASIHVVRAFVKLRGFFAAHKELAQKLAELERKIAGHDHEIVTLMAAIRGLMESPSRGRRKVIGFRSHPGSDVLRSSP